MEIFLIFPMCFLSSSVAYLLYAGKLEVVTMTYIKSYVKRIRVVFVEGKQ